HSVIAADLDDETVPAARAVLDDLPGHLFEVSADHHRSGCPVGVIGPVHLAGGNGLQLLHHGARGAHPHREPEERNLVGVLRQCEGVRHGLATEVENLTQDTVADTASVVGHVAPYLVI